MGGGSSSTFYFIVFVRTKDKYLGLANENREDSSGAPKRPS